MSAISDLSRYYVTQMRSISTSTTNYSFGFLFVLFIIWHGTLTNLQTRIKEGISEKNRADELEAFTKELKKQYDAKLRVGTERFDAAARTTPNEYQREIANARLNFTERLRNMKTMRDSANKQKAKALERFSMIKDSIVVEFNIPTLQPVKEKSRLGTMLWLLLMDVAIFMVIAARRRIFSYLERLALSLDNDKVQSDELYKLDFHLPFWAFPVHLNFDNKNSKYLGMQLVKSEARKQQYLLLGLIITVLTIVQLNVFWINWNLNVKIFDDKYSFISKALSLLFLAGYFALLLYWFVAQNKIAIKTPVTQSEKKAISRRDFIKPVVGIPGLMLLFLISPLDKLIPVMKPTDLRRRRVRKDAMKHNPLTNKKPGFYINDKNVVHYVSPKLICMSLKTVTPAEKSAFLKQLKQPVTLEKLDGLRAKISVPFASWVFLTELSSLMAGKKTEEAAHLIQLALTISRRGRYKLSENFLASVDNFLYSYTGPRLSNLRMLRPAPNPQPN